MRPACRTEGCEKPVRNVGGGRLDTLCYKCRHPKPRHRPGYGNARTRRRQRHKGPVCERCGFVPEHPSQLDIDHIVPLSEGGADDPSNYQTLCANCHRLKTLEEKRRHLFVRSTTWNSMR